jgi:hypothetical protein
MDSKAMTRKDFITLTFTLIGSGVALDACSSSNNNGGTAGNNGTSGTNGAAGTTGVGGHAGTNGAAGTSGGAGTGGGTSACTNPLPETQDADGLLHTHSLDVPASLLDSTSDQTLTTGSAMAPGGSAHMHTVLLTVANLAILKAGGNVDVPSGITLSHMHSYTINCH